MALGLAGAHSTARACREPPRRNPHAAAFGTHAYSPSSTGCSPEACRYEAREPWIWNVYFGPGLYMYHANSIKELKEIFSSGKAFEINSFFRHDLSGGKYELEITVTMRA